MEHRWGQRLSVDLAVRIAGRPYNVRSARLADLSASGAYIKVHADLRPLSRVQIAIALPHKLTRPTPMVAAYVVRRCKDGIGVEWCEYAPQPVLELLRYAAAHRHDHHRTAEMGRYDPASDPWDEPKSFAEA
jgi:PilZ domain